MRRSIPGAVSSARMVDQANKRVSLASWRGETVVIVPFLTLCSDICPLTTGNLLQVENALRASGVAGKVQIVEMSVDPSRDTPRRLAAYARITGSSWELVSESAASLVVLSHFFGFYFARSAEERPPSIDWWTGKPLAYDVDHSDGFVVVSRSGKEIFATGATPEFRGSLPPKLYRFLSEAGHSHLLHASSPSWRPADLTGVLSWALGKHVSIAG
jgi:protein SCO1